MDTDAGETPTETLPLAIVTAVDPVIEVFETEVAVTLTTLGLGVVAGAVYKPVEVIDPQLTPAHPAPDTLHITILLCGPLAENWIWPWGLTWGFAGVIVNVGTATTVTVAVPDFVRSTTEVALTVTAAGEGTEAGAV